MKNFFNTYKEKAKEKPIKYFSATVGSIVGAMVLATVVITPPAQGTATTQPQKQVTQQPQKPQKQQTKPAKNKEEVQQNEVLPVVSWQGVRPICSGPVAVFSTGNVEVEAMSGTIFGGEGGESFLITSAGSAMTGLYDDSQDISITFPLGGKYNSMEFKFAQQVIEGNIRDYAYSSVIQIMLDGELYQEKIITKDNLLVVDEQESIPIEDVNQLVLKIKTIGKITENQSGYKTESDKYGPFFQLILGDLNFVKKGEDTDEKA